MRGWLTTKAITNNKNSGNGAGAQTAGADSNDRG